MFILFISTVVIGVLGIYFGVKVFKIAQVQRLEREEEFKKHLALAQSLYDQKDYVNAAIEMRKLNRLVGMGVHPTLKAEYDNLKEKMLDYSLAMQKVYDVEGEE